MEFFEGNGRMSKVVKHNGVLYLCGQTGTPGNNMKEQTAEVLKKVEDLLDIVKLGVITTPSVMVDGKLIVSGQVASAKAIAKLLQK